MTSDDNNTQELVEVPVAWLEGLLRQLHTCDASLTPIDLLTPDGLKNRADYAMLAGYISSAESLIERGQL